MSPAEVGLGDGFRELDDLVLHLKGLVLVRGLRERLGADEGELPEPPDLDARDPACVVEAGQRGL